MRLEAESGPLEGLRRRIGPWRGAFGGLSGRRSPCGAPAVRNRGAERLSGRVLRCYCDGLRSAIATNRCPTAVAAPPHGSRSSTSAPPGPSRIAAWAAAAPASGCSAPRRWPGHGPCARGCHPRRTSCRDDSGWRSPPASDRAAERAGPGLRPPARPAK